MKNKSLYKKKIVKYAMFNGISLISYNCHRNEMLKMDPNQPLSYATPGSMPGEGRDPVEGAPHNRGLLQQLQSLLQQKRENGIHNKEAWAQFLQNIRAFGIDSIIDQEHGRDALHIIAENNEVKLAGALLLEGGADIFSQNNQKRETILHVAIRMKNPNLARLSLNSNWFVKEDAHGQRNNVRRFLSIRCAPESDSEVGKCPLDLAVELNNFEIVDIILRNWFPFTSPTSGETFQPYFKQIFNPFSYAIKQGYVKIVKQFLDVELLKSPLGYPPILLKAKSQDNKNAFHIAAEYGQTEIMRLLLERGDFEFSSLESRDANGYTPMHYAVCSGSTEVFKLLYQQMYGRRELDTLGIADREVVKEGGEDVLKVIKVDLDDPICMGVKMGKTAILATFLELMQHKLRDPLQYNDLLTQDSPLHIAVSQNNVNMVELFLKNRHKWDMVVLSKKPNKNKKGLTPWEVARSLGHVEIQRLFKQYCPDVKEIQEQDIE